MHNPFNHSSHLPSVWYSSRLASRLNFSAKNRSWLLETASLTQRIQSQCSVLRVNILSESWGIPLRQESQQLQLATNQYAWIRTIELQCHNHKMIYARTVIPHCHPGNPWYSLKQLGNRPLGEVLFQLPALQRTEFLLNKSSSERWPLLEIKPKKVLARQSTFLQNQHPLLLTEVFLNLDC